MRGKVAAAAAGAVATGAILIGLPPGMASLRGVSSEVGAGAGAHVGGPADARADTTAPTTRETPPPATPASVHTIRLTDGDDEVTLKPDGKADEVWCGAGTDTVVFFPEPDPLDVLHDCEEFLNLLASP